MHIRRYNEAIQIDCRETAKLEGDGY